MPKGQETDQMRLAAAAGARIVQHTAGYNSVIVHRAREFAAKQDYAHIPFGMECYEAVKQTAKQTEGIPDTVKRIVIPVGSGMSVAGVLAGLVAAERNIPILGVVIGAKPEKRLDSFAPFGWRRRLSLVDAGLPYAKSAPNTEIFGVEVDPYYEAKCLPFLREGDMFWVVGIRPTV